MERQTEQGTVHRAAVWSVAAAVVAMLGLVPDMALGQSWRSGSCEQSKTSNSFETEPPQAYMMLDRSGSMDNCIDGDDGCDGWNERWQTAVDSIKNAASSMLTTDPPQVELGLGMFADSICVDTEPIDICWYVPLLGSFCITVNEAGKACGEAPWGDRYCADVSKDLICVWESTNNYVSPGDLGKTANSNTIAEALDGESPGGETPMASGIYETSEELTGADPSRDQAGILIADGEPSGEHDEVIEAACQHSESTASTPHAAPLYVVGLGSGVSLDVNHAVAAAGGTGKCCKSGTSCTRGGPKAVDICTKAENGNLPDYFVDEDGDWQLNYQCTGAYQAYSETGLSDTISSITNDLTCSVDVSSWGSSGDGANKWSDPWYDCTPETKNGETVAYDCFDLQMPGTPSDSSYDQEVLYHKDSSRATSDWYWEWMSSAQDKIRLSDKACEYVASEDTSSNTVDVSLACMCDSRPVDNKRSAVSGKEIRTCPISNPGICECSRGRAICNQGYNKCDQFEAINVEKWNASDHWDKCRAPQELAGEGEICSPCGEDGDPIKCTKQTVEDCRDAIENPPDVSDETCDTGLPGRCSVGAQYCTEDGWSECKQVYRAVPEICNGRDDDCDGQVDNIHSSWENGPPEEDVSSWNFELEDLERSYRARACGGIHACRCPSGAADDKHRGSSSDMMSVREEFESMVDNTKTDCYCAE